VTGGQGVQDTGDSPLIPETTSGITCGGTPNRYPDVQIIYAISFSGARSKRDGAISTPLLSDYSVVNIFQPSRLCPRSWPNLWRLYCGHCEISKEMSSLYFRRDAVCIFEARARLYDAVYIHFHSCSRLLWRLRVPFVRLWQPRTSLRPQIQYNFGISFLI
jgi:hypothetical protein